VSASGRCRRPPPIGRLRLPRPAPRGEAHRNTPRFSDCRPSCELGATQRGPGPKGDWDLGHLTGGGGGPGAPGHDAIFRDITGSVRRNNPTRLLRRGHHSPPGGLNHLGRPPRRPDTSAASRHDAGLTAGRGTDPGLIQRQAGWFPSPRTIPAGRELESRPDDTWARGGFNLMRPQRPDLENY